MRAAVVALGCPKNRVDSEHLLGAFLDAGYELTETLPEADLIVLTTCAFLSSAVQETEDAIRNLVRLKENNPSLKLFVAGCLVERYGRSLKKRFPGVDRWLTLKEMNRFLPGKDARLISTPSHYAYLKIADGCDNRCSYCLIPDIRGKFRSRRIEEIVAEAEALASAGVKELILIAQDTTLYGKDVYGAPALARLLSKLEQIKGLRWVRLLYTHPAHLQEDVIEQFGSNSKLCRYIDLPIQHISDRILALMNRRYTRRDVEKLLGRLRTVPEMRVRTTVITGFPGETEAEFEELLQFVKQTQFDRLSGYVFSPEPGTRASTLSGQVDKQTAQLRLRRIMQTQARISRAKLRSMVGQNTEVLMDFPNEGRTEWDAPEIDGVVQLRGEKASPGTFINVKIVASSTYDLTAEKV
ncbi:30S ribosomal protein S12 methylthiotransferase RimO [candidate division WOR-3 bacterium]|nr:30S ribosomal protein S12 methylthiotransferase RimO [candidate division WOR-3 bacterium]